MKFADVLIEHSVRFQTEGKHCRPGWLQLDCPFCRGPLYMGYNLSRRYLNCWRCGPKSVGETLSLLTNKPWQAIREIVKQIEPDRAIVERIRSKLVMPRGVGELLPIHINYLESRGFDVNELEALWKIRGIGLSSELAWRIFIPIIHQGETVSWTTRSVSDTTKTRYVSANAEQEALNHKELIYGEDYVRHAVIIHEGPTDVWRTGPGAVCTFGTGFKTAQVNRLKRFPVRVVCFDNEPQAQRRAELLCDLLEVFPGETWNVTLDGKDSASSSRRDVEKLRKTFLE